MTYICWFIEHLWMCDRNGGGLYKCNRHTRKMAELLKREYGSLWGKAVVDMAT